MGKENNDLSMYFLIFLVSSSITLFLIVSQVLRNKISYRDAQKANVCCNMSNLNPALSLAQKYVFYSDNKNVFYSEYPLLF